MSDKETNKRQKVEKFPLVCTLYEFMDFEALRDIYEMHLPSEYEYKVVGLYKAMLKNDSQRIPVEYYESETSPQGRLYASGPSLQNLKGWIKRALSWRTHFDLDFVLCGPSLWQQLLHLKVPRYDDKLHLLNVLINDREFFYKQISSNRDYAKTTVNAIINGQGDCYDNSYLNSLKKNIRRACKMFIKLPEYNEAWLEFHALDEKNNHPQKFVAREVFKLERFCLNSMVAHLQKKI